MIIKGIFGITIHILSIISLAACNNTNLDENYSNSEIVAFNLIKVCVDSAVKKFPEANTRNYVVNLTGMKTLNKKGIDKYIEFKRSTLPTIQEDSIVITGKDGRSYMKQSMLINFLEIEPKNDKYVVVKLTKLKTNKELVKLTFELERHKLGYRIIYSLATR